MVSRLGGRGRAEGNRQNNAAQTLGGGERDRRDRERGGRGGGRGGGGGEGEEGGGGGGGGSKRKKKKERTASGDTITNQKSFSLRHRPRMYEWSRELCNPAKKKFGF